MNHFNDDNRHQGDMSINDSLLIQQQQQSSPPNYSAYAQDYKTLLMSEEDQQLSYGTGLNGFQSSSSSMYAGRLGSSGIDDTQIAASMGLKPNPSFPDMMIPMMPGGSSKLYGKKARDREREREAKEKEGKKSKGKKTPTAASMIQNFRDEVFMDPASLLQSSNISLDKDRPERDENATSSLTKRRGPLLSKLTTFEQQHFLARKGFPFHHSRPKSHWDYVMDEVQWMSLDFRQELRWKQAMAKQLAYACKEARDERFSAFATLRKSPTRNSKSVESKPLRDICSKISSVFTQQWKHWEVKLQHRMKTLKDAEILSMIKGSNEVAAESMEDLIEKVLSIPSMLHSNNVMIPNYCFPPSLPEFMREAVDTYEILGRDNKSIKMMDHQECIFRDILRLGELGYGSMIYGSSYSGKTVSVSYALIFWLLEELKKRKEIQVNGLDSPVCGLVFATLHGVWHWLLVLQQFCKSYVEVKLWDEDHPDVISSHSDKAMHPPTILLVPIEKYEVFCQSAVWRQIQPISTTAENHRVGFCGVVLDLRGSQQYVLNNPGSPSQDVSDGEVGRKQSSPIPVDTKLTENQKHYKVVIGLSSLLPDALRKRVLITDDSFQIIDRVSVLSFLIPGISYQQLYERFNVGDNSLCSSFVMESYKRNPESHIIPLEQVNKNTLHQLLINLSIHAIIPMDLNTRAYAQIREETAIVELSPSQQKKYDETSAVLVRSGHYNGADIEKLTRILSLLKLICFHSDFVTLRKVPNQIPANFTPANSTQFFVYKPTLSKAAQLAANLDSNPSSMATLFSQGPLVGKISHLPQLKHSSMMHVSPSGRSLSPFMEPPLGRGNGDLLLEGSNKLKAVRSLLQRFDGLRVVIVASHWMELSLIHQYLQLQEIEHIYPHLFLKYGQQLATSTSWTDSAINATSIENSDKPSNPFSDKPNLEKLFWLAQESNIQLFNDPSVLSSILLTTFHTFQSPSTSPWLADAVILLSHHWDSYFDLKNCFRMRLLHTGPQGDPVTIVRVCSKNTIEEVLCKQKVGVPQLQGQRLSDIHFTIKDMSPLLASLELDIGQSATTFLKNAPVMPAIKPGHNTHNQFGVINTNSHNNLFGIVHSPTVENPGSGSSKNMFFNERSVSASSSISSTQQNIQQNILPGGLTQSLSLNNIMSMDSDVVPLSSNSVPNAASMTPSVPMDINGPPSLVRRRSGGGKGMIILGPQGKTQFVKENQVTSGHNNGNTGITSRSGIWSALFTLDEEQQRADECKFEKQLTIQWLQVFQNHLQLGICELSCVPNIRPANPATFAGTALDQFYLHQQQQQQLMHPQQLPQETCVSGSKYFKSQQLFSLINEIIIYQTYGILQKRDVTMRQNIHDPLLLQRRPPCEMAINLVFLQSVYFQLLANEEVADNNEDYDSIMSRDVLKALGAGVPRYDAFMTQQLFIAPSPMNLRYVNTKDMISTSVEDTSDAAGGIQPQSAAGGNALQKSLGFVMFKDYLYESMRNGTQLEPWLFTNPLQVASRHDAVTLPSYLETCKREDIGIKFRYMVKGASTKSGGYKKANKALAASTASAVAVATTSTGPAPPLVSPDSFDLDILDKDKDKSIKKSSSSRDFATSIEDESLLLGFSSMKKRDRSNYPDAPELFEDSQSRSHIQSEAAMMVEDEAHGYDPSAPIDYSSYTNIQPESVSPRSSYANYHQNVNINIEPSQYDLVNKRLKSSSQGTASTNSVNSTSSAPSPQSSAGQYSNSSLASASAGASNPYAPNYYNQTPTSQQHFIYQQNSTIGAGNNSAGLTSSTTTSSSVSSKPVASAGITSKYLVPNYNANTNGNTPATSTSALLKSTSSSTLALPNTNTALNSNDSYYYSTANAATGLNALGTTVSGGTTNSNNYPGSYHPFNSTTTNGVNNSVATSGVVNPPSVLHPAALNSNSSGGTTTSANVNVWNGPQLLSGNLSPHNASTTTISATTGSAAPASQGYYGYHQQSQPQTYILPSVSNALSSNKQPVTSQGVLLGGNANYGGSQYSSKRQRSELSPRADLTKNGSYSGGGALNSMYGPATAANNEEIWLPVEDDIMICMQNATSDPNFVYTIHWLNNAKGITRTIPRTAEEARIRYQFLCSSGKKDSRLKDSNVNRTITKLMKSMKRPTNGNESGVDGSTDATVAVEPHSASGDATQHQTADGTTAAVPVQNP